MKMKLSSTQKNIIEWIFCILIAILLALIIKYFIGTPTLVNRTSMYPTLKSGERLILNRIPKTLNQIPKRGEIITFEAPSRNLDVTSNQVKAIYGKDPQGLWNRFVYYVLETSKTSYIKRVIALPGERVEIKEGSVYINGEKLEEDYLEEGMTTQSSGLEDFIVPEGYLFAMGDNRTKSVDCREFGCIPIEKIEGKVVIRFWPLNRLGTVK